MVVTLTGENSFGLKAELGKLIAGFLAKHDEFGLERIDGEEVEFPRLQEAVTSLPFLAERKMVVVRRPSANKEFTEKAELLLAGIPDATDLIIIEPKLDKRLAYYKFLKKKTDFREFNELDINGLARWVVTEAKSQGGSIDSRDAQYLVERVGASQQLLKNEVEKLHLYDPKITRETIDLLTEATPQSTIFQLLESAFAGNTKKAMQLYKEQRALKVEPQQIVAMLAWQLHILALVKTAGDRPGPAIASQAKISPYVVQKTQAIARNLTFSELKTLVNDLLIIDTRSKRESLDVDEALQNYLLKLAN